MVQLVTAATLAISDAIGLNQVALASSVLVQVNILVGNVNALLTVA